MASRERLERGLADAFPCEQVVLSLDAEYTPDPVSPSTFTNTAFIALINDGGAAVERFNYREIETLDVSTLAGDDYVVLDDDEIKAAFPKSTQTIEIEAFVQASEIDFVLLERPYYLEPMAKADKVYALLREGAARTGRSSSPSRRVRSRKVSSS